MARGYLNDVRYRKTDIVKYIEKLMIEKHMNQADVAERLGKTQSWMSKKMSHCGFYVGELIEIFKVLDADPEKVGNLLVIGKG